MNNIEFGRLSDLDLRSAWKYEDKDFTPWLAQNIDRLAEIIGIPLELTDTEVQVETFYADILARNPGDGTIVLIENQFTPTDHTHLGQIMTYLAGLDAQTVVWIAPKFREAHLSTIRWLNEHTSDGFSFFAIRLRVVQIEDSPVAPIFEIVEQPDDWARMVSQQRRSGGAPDPSSDVRLALWTRYLERYPESERSGFKPKRSWNQYQELCDGAMLLSVWVGEKQAGIYLRGGWAERKFEAREKLAPHIEELLDTLGCRYFEDHKDGHVIGERISRAEIGDAQDDALIDWLESRRQAYLAALEAVGVDRRIWPDRPDT